MPNASKKVTASAPQRGSATLRPCRRAVLSASVTAFAFGVTVAEPAPAAALVGSAALSIPHPDAALLSACAAFDEIERQANDLIEVLGGEVADAQADALHETQEPLLDVICSHRAVTIEAQRRRAETLIIADLELNPEEDAKNGYRNQRITAAMLRDLLAAQPGPHPDAALLGHRPEFDRLQAAKDVTP